MSELILNSNDHKVASNKLRYEFKSPVKFDNSYISLTQAIFYNFFIMLKKIIRWMLKRIIHFIKYHL